jgi:hypothetical protein
MASPVPTPPAGARPPMQTILILFAILVIAAFALVLFVLLRR